MPHSTKPKKARTRLSGLLPDKGRLTLAASNLLLTMGNACCGSSEERPKTGTLLSIPDSSNDSDFRDSNQAASNHGHSASSAPSWTASEESTNSKIATPTPTPQHELERLKAVREEQTRLEWIVQSAGRKMVAVRSTRGGTAYYDQGFAAALAQHLEQTTQFADSVPITLPPASSTSSVYARLSAPAGDGIMAVGGTGDGTSSSDGARSVGFFDHAAEQYVESVLVKKEQLFAGTAPMVENLL